jgi:4-hydroxy-3-methylbut-2-en-1-yl diphosphate reductase
MRVYLAEYMGLCFGVRDALHTAEKVERPDEVSIYGELVHNPTIQNGLKERGFQTLRENQRGQAELRNRVMITAHGVSDRRLAVLQRSTQEVIDTTCPLVRRVHEVARSMQDEGRLVIILGKASHVEVQGVVEDLTEALVIEDLQQVQCWKSKKLGVLCQSTTTPDQAEECLKQIQSLNPASDIRYSDTICRPTRQRQEALVDLCQKSSLIIVVGGHQSNNTQRLVQRAKQLGCEAYGVESANELNADWFQGHDSVGLTAGTSTPDSTINEVKHRIEAISPNRAKGFSETWRSYFERNLMKLDPIAWRSIPTLTPNERGAVLKSIQVFQLGESGTGRHFLALAQKWAEAKRDSDYVQAVGLFLKEEHRHADLLRRFLAQELTPSVVLYWEHRAVFRAACWTFTKYARKCYRHWRIARSLMERKDEYCQARK